MDGGDLEVAVDGAAAADERNSRGLNSLLHAIGISGAVRGRSADSPAQDLEGCRGEEVVSWASHRQSRSLLEQRLRARNSTRSKCSMWAQVGRNIGASGSGRGSGAGSGAPEHHAPEHRTVS